MDKRLFFFHFIVLSLLLATLNVSAQIQEEVLYRINAGGAAVTNSIGSFSTDQYFGASSNTATKTNAIAGTLDDAMYQSERYGNRVLSYNFPVTNGQYKVILHFAEIYFSRTGQRVFDIYLEQTKYFDNYDIAAKVGVNTATTETIATSVNDGQLNLTLSGLESDGGLDNPKLSAIEVIKINNVGAPVVVNTIPDQFAKIGSPFSYTFSLNSFADPDNDQLTYSASMANGSALPNWLSFDATTRTFSGTAPLSTASYSLAVTAHDGSGGTVQDFFVLTITQSVEGELVYRINSGGFSINSSIGSFSPDNYFTPGSSSFTNNSLAIAGTTDDGLYRSERYGTGSLGYNFPVTNGQYVVVLHFAEILYSNVGQRVFDISVEENKVFDNYDIVKRAGALTAITETYTATVTDESLNIVLSGLPADGGVANPKISALEVYKITSTKVPLVSSPIPDQNILVQTAFNFSFPVTTFSDPDNDPLTYTATVSNGDNLPSWISFNSSTRTFSGIAPPSPTPLTLKITANDGNGGTVSDYFQLNVVLSSQEVPIFRINAGGAVNNNSIGSFTADQYFSGTTATFTTTTAIEGTTDDALYQNERYGTGALNYNFPAIPGKYRVVLHFSELYHTAANQRMFDVSMEGIKKLDNYDIFSKAGGSFRARVESFEIVVTDGQLNIYFSSLSSDGGKSNPCIAAIEVLKINLPGVAPTAFASEDKKLPSSKTSLIIEGAGTDEDGTVSAYLWTKVSGPSVTMSSSNTANLSLSALQQGTYVFRLSVMDNDFHSSTDDIVVKVLTPLQYDFEILKKLYEYTDGPNWTNKENWLSDDLSNWYGVVVLDERVAYINLEGNQLNGTIPQEIGELDKLLYLILNNNNLQGTIPPKLFQLKELILLSLNNNQLEGNIHGLDGLSMLQEFFVSGNNLSGSMPTDLSSLTNLWRFDVSGNNFDGSIPLSLAEVPNLVILNLSDNQFSGEIPRLFFENLYLNEANFSNNNFSILPNVFSNAMVITENNRFDFGDFEHNFASPNSPSSAITYSPQKEILIKERVNVEENGLLEIELKDIGGEYNAYQWQKLNSSAIWENIEGSTSKTLRIENFSNSNIGKYRCVITNSWITDLTLYTTPVETINRGKGSDDLDINWTLVRTYDEDGREISAAKTFHDNLARPHQTQLKKGSGNTVIVKGIEVSLPFNSLYRKLEMPNGDLVVKRPSGEVFLKKSTGEIIKKGRSGEIMVSWDKGEVVMPSNGEVLATQTIYDKSGRAALSSLVAPINKISFAYKPDFITNTNNEKYSYSDFTNNGAPSSAANSEIGSLGYYYSNNNSFEGLVASSNYPFSLTQYYNLDGSDEVKSSSGPGDYHVKGSGHDVYSKSLPLLNEMDEYLDFKNRFVFPNATNKPTTLRNQGAKTVSIDENGNEIISFMDKEGRSIASALTGSGHPLRNMTQTLGFNYYYSNFEINKDIYESATILIEGTTFVDVFDTDNGAIIFSGPVSNYELLGLTLTKQVTNVQVRSTSNFQLSHLVFATSPDVPFAFPFLTRQQVNQGETLTASEIHVPRNMDITISLSALTASVKVGIINMINNTVSEIMLQTSQTITLNSGFYKISVEWSSSKSAYDQLLSFSYQYPLGNLSYNYYNELDQLVTTITPNGVAQLNAGDPYELIDKTVYRYNYLGWLLETIEPDGGKTEYVYRKDGAIRFSQNAEQRLKGAFSFTNYDKIGRAVESAEYVPAASSDVTFKSAAMTSILENTVLDCKNTSEDGLINSNKKHWLHTFYDLADPNFTIESSQMTLTPQFIEGAVSYTENEEVKSWYSYDELGRMKWMIQRLKNAGPRVVTIEYSYDFLGNVKEVIYQRNYADQFFHKYVYDEEKRLKEVYTSTNGTNYQLEATYHYYLHGPLKRLELADKLQGIDYVYTIQGWLKSINNSNPGAANDPGGDGANGFATDAFGMSLEYFSGDYTRSGVNVSSINTSTDFVEQFNGNIRGFAWQTGRTSTSPALPASMYSYRYDNKYQLTDAQWGEVDFATRTVAPGNSYKEGGIAYDLNGNIEYLSRYNATTATNYDYNYLSLPSGQKTNQLANVSGYKNFSYNSIGQLHSEELISNANKRYIDYEVGGKVRGVYSTYSETTKGYSNPQAKFAYDDRGFRIMKESAGGKQTWYVRDLSGNILSIYERSNSADPVAQVEVPLYGSGRVGTSYINRLPNGSLNYQYNYEIYDHLGNVRAIVGRQKTATSSSDILNWSEYYPFGSTLSRAPKNTYRFGYQGQFAEKDEETGWNSFELRMYDPVIGRWLSTDPAGQYASPYVGMGNNPVSSVDPDGAYSRPGAWWRNVLYGQGDIYQVNGEWGYNSIEGDAIQWNDGVNRNFGTKAFKSEVELSVGPQVGFEASYGDEQIGIDLNLVSFTIFEHEYEQQGNQYGPEKHEISFPGYKNQIKVKQELSAAVPLFERGVEREFNVDLRSGAAYDEKLKIKGRAVFHTVEEEVEKSHGAVHYRGGAEVSIKLKYIIGIEIKANFGTTTNKIN